MQITKTEYDAELLKEWEANGTNATQIGAKLAEYVGKFKGVFTNVTQVKNFEIYIKGLLSKVPRKSVEPIALELMGKSGVRTLQNFMRRSNFEEEKVLGHYQNELGQTLSRPGGMLSIDPSEFVKKGKHSAGVKRQYCGRLGKVENCQSVVFAAYAGGSGYGLVDRELYIPEEWYDESHKKLREECGIAETKVFKTKNEIALEMIDKIVEKNILEIKWIGSDASFGCDHHFIDSLPKTAYYFLGITCKERVFLPGEVSPVTVKFLAENDAFPWEKVGFDGSKGVSYSDVKVIRCAACRTEKNNTFRHHEIWLYIRRYADGKTKFFLSNAPENIPKEELHQAAALRWPIEQCFEECKSFLGMADFEGRSYNGFLRHLLFVMIAHFFGTSLRLSLKKTAFP